MFPHGPVCSQSVKFLYSINSPCPITVSLSVSLWMLKYCTKICLLCWPETELLPSSRMSYKAISEGKQRITPLLSTSAVYFSFSIVVNIIVCLNASGLTHIPLRGFHNENRSQSRKRADVRSLSLSTCLLAFLPQILWYINKHDQNLFYFK